METTIKHYFKHGKYDDFPKPIFSRQVNGPNAQIINAKNKHNKLIKLLGNELSTKYVQYKSTN